MLHVTDGHCNISDRPQTSVNGPMVKCSDFAENADTHRYRHALMCQRIDERACARVFLCLGECARTRACTSVNEKHPSPNQCH